MVEVGPRSLPVVLDAQPDGTAQGVGLGQPRGERNTLLNLLPPLRFRLSAVVEAESPTRIPKASPSGRNAGIEVERPAKCGRRCPGI